MPLEPSPFGCGVYSPTLPSLTCVRIFHIVVGHRLNCAAAEQRERGMCLFLGMHYWIPAAGHILCVGFLRDGKGSMWVLVCACVAVFRVSHEKPTQQKCGYQFTGMVDEAINVGE